MPSWKKVIVSGSDAVLNSLAVSTNQSITTLQSTTKVTGSFTGSFAGDGTNITGITATGLNIPGTVTQVTIQPFVVSGSAALQKISFTDVLNQMTGSNNSGITMFSTASLLLDTGSTHFTNGVRGKVSAVSYLGYNSATGVFTFDSGSYGTFSAGNGLTSTNGVHDVGAGNGIAVAADSVSVDTGSTHFSNGAKTAVFQAGNFVDSSYVDFTVTTGTSVTAVLISGSIQNGHLANSGITFGATPQALGSTVSSLSGLTTVSATNISGTNVTGSSRVHSSGDLTAQNLISSSNGNIKADLGYIQAGTPAGAPATAGNVNATALWGQTLTTTGQATLNSANITNNLTVGGDLTVNGTASFINSTNLYVKDQFILLNSGSSTLQDSGIVMQYSSSGVGSAIYLDAVGAYGRFGIAINISGTATTVTTDSYLVSVSSSTGAPGGLPTWGTTGNNYGNMYVNSSDESIWIFS